MYQDNEIAVVGVGYVGKGMLKIFPGAVQFDGPLNIGEKDEVNKCKLAIVCVPTPSKEDGSCDTSTVEGVVDWLKTDLILVKSALEPGTTEKMKKKHGKRIVVSPEYMGESKYWTHPKYPHPQDPISHGFLILGGDDADCSDIADIFVPRLGPSARIRFMTSLEAEIVKYAENSWGAMKVSFANELRNICEALGASWHRVREGWLDDPRVESMHTAVFKHKRGFGGKCFPKDTMAFLKTAEKAGLDSVILRAIIDHNKKYHEKK